MIQKSYSSVYTQTKQKQDLQQIPALLCRLQYHSQWPRYGNNQNVYQQKNGYRRCERDIYNVHVYIVDIYVSKCDNKC